MAEKQAKEGAITHTEEYDAHKEAVRVLRKIKQARHGRCFRVIRVDHQTWREVELKTNIKNITL